MKRTKCALLQAEGANFHLQTVPKVLAVSRLQLQEMRQLITSYGDSAPLWLRSSTKLTRPRRRQLLNYLEEAGLDSSYCIWIPNEAGWSYELHKLYHQLETGK